MLRDDPLPQKTNVWPTYRVTIIMLLLGQVQVAVAMEIKPLKKFLAERYYLSLIQFFISFLSIQLYGFFYSIIVKKPVWARVMAGLWTYEVNTMSIMKPAKRAPHMCLIMSFFLTIVIMIIGVIYGNKATNHRKGLFEQGDPVERANICTHLFWHHRVRRNEAGCHRVSHPACLHPDLECVRHYIRRLDAKAGLLPSGFKRRSHFDRPTVLPQRLRSVHGIRVDDVLVPGADGMGRVGCGYNQVPILQERRPMSATHARTIGTAGTECLREVRLTHLWCGSCSVPRRRWGKFVRVTRLWSFRFDSVCRKIDSCFLGTRNLPIVAKCK
ncbi:uncharacterized protein LOC108096852 isoform X1 [Drosophila ficusphila]|uniref:uncharacterized protein LOC108096852 isoform X1 n=1 Tax=Drosophila ficusphila TaxID=30025 RepID=UPI0007E83BA0|nr:uncharacterized protein LOC108096852 isoform X1 [Drosophila ficusphila]